MVSIVLPTYNRAHLLRQAVDSIQAQTYQSWELIIVDNASSDDTSQVIAEIAANLRQPVRSVILQENQGPSRAFNRGIDEARAPYTAFLCDDDLWLPHHLEDCISALENNRDVDWVFAAMRRVELSTGRVLHPSTFCVDGRPHPFLCLNVQRRGRLCVVDDPNARKCVLSNGGVGDIIVSVYRRQVFERVRPRNFGDGQTRFFLVEAVHGGLRLAYLNNVHAEYRIHGSHNSAAGPTMALEVRQRAILRLLDAYVEMMRVIPLDRQGRRALRRSLANDCFWTYAYGLLWTGGRRREALKYFWRGIRYWPWDVRYWKTFFLCSLRTIYGAWRDTLGPVNK